MDAADLATFKRQGFVVVRGLVPLAQVDDWRAQAWDTLTIDEAEAQRTWPAGGGNRNVNLFKPEHRSRVHYPYSDQKAPADPFPLSPPVGQQPQVKAVLDFLLGENTYGAGIAAPGEQGAGLERDCLVFNWPQAPEKRSADMYNGVDRRNRGGGHIEGYRGWNKGGPTPQWQVGVTLYLDDVGPGGGSTYVWPRSHLAVHRYFKEHPRDMPTGGAICTSKPPGTVHGIPSPRLGGNGMSEQYMREHLPGGYDGGEPHEAVMQKGDAMVWHHWCVHASNYNGSNKVLAMGGRVIK
jgi:hypothetical protein